MQADTYVLYGSYASYFTAKTRAYLRKKGVPFVERLPSDPQFRNHVRPTSGSHRIPQLLAPDGTVVQDSILIQDYLEARFPELPAIPRTPCQRIYVHLMELFASEGLLQLAWMHRWLFAENLDFVIKDFGRSFRPQGSDEELRHYGQLIADRMMSYGLPESTPELRAELDEQYRALLEVFEAHLVEHPYLLGGHPSAADYAMMGALHAHMGRDPAGLRMMQLHAPRTFRWMEHMLVPDLQAPEFFDVPVVYPADDEVPGTALKLLAHIAERYGRNFVLSVLAFNDFAAEQDLLPGQVLDPEHDQPLLPKRQVNFDGEAVSHAANLHHVWLAQRARLLFQGVPEADQYSIAEVLDSPSVLALLKPPIGARIQRQNGVMVIAERNAN